jgi:hypothetical protein
MTSKEKEKSALTKKLHELSLIANSEDFENWNTGLLHILREIGAPQDTIEEFYGFPSLDAVFDNNTSNEELDKNINKQKTLLRNYIEIIAIRKAPKIAKPINFKVNQTSKHSTKININFEVILNSVKDDLTGRQWSEIQEILESNDAPEAKKKGVLEKIRSFGKDVSSNIVAGILTNPDVLKSILGSL